MRSSRRQCPGRTGTRRRRRAARRARHRTRRPRISPPHRAQADRPGTRQSPHQAGPRQPGRPRPARHRRRHRRIQTPAAAASRCQASPAAPRHRRPIEAPATCGSPQTCRVRTAPADRSCAGDRGRPTRTAPRRPGAGHWSPRGRSRPRGIALAGLYPTARADPVRHPARLRSGKPSPAPTECACQTEEGRCSGCGNGVEVVLDHERVIASGRSASVDADVIPVPRLRDELRTGLA